MPDEKTGIQRAVEAIGSQKKLAKLMREAGDTNVTQSRVWHWVQIGYVPKKRAASVAELTGVPLADLLRQ